MFNLKLTCLPYRTMENKNHNHSFFLFSLIQIARGNYFTTHVHSDITAKFSVFLTMLIGACRLFAVQKFSKTKNLYVINSITCHQVYKKVYLTKVSQIICFLDTSPQETKLLFSFKISLLRF